ncbi:nlaXM [Symbiodinium sp. CCMP2456]|nr:nlaXM [Symbiodinium sp. CCMP2456]
MAPKKNASVAKAKAKLPAARPKAKQTAKAKAANPGSGADTSRMTQVRRPDPATGELRSVTLVTPPASTPDKVVQPLTDYWRSAFKADDNDFSEKRQKLSPSRDSAAASASTAHPPPPPTMSAASSPQPTVPEPMDETEEAMLIAELETQIIPPSPQSPLRSLSRQEEGPATDGDDASHSSDNDTGFASFDEMAQVRSVAACEITPFKQKFLQKHVLDCSSVVTFKGVCHMIRRIQPLCFILENVDSLESAASSNDDDKEPSKSNLEMIMAWLNDLGYKVTVEKMRSDDYGLPQRRSRLYFFGLRSSDLLAEPAEDSLCSVGDRLLLLRKKECFLHPEDDNILEEELERLRSRANDKAAASIDKGDGVELSTKGDRWREIHSSMAEQSCSLNCVCIALIAALWGLGDRCHCC